MVGARARMRLNHRLMLTTKAVNKHWRFTLARPRYLARRIPWKRTSSAIFGSIPRRLFISSVNNSVFM